MGWRTCLLVALVACSAPPPDDVIDPPHCGDGVVQADEGEQCDDGNAISGDGCSSTCKSEGMPFVHAVWNLLNIDGMAASCPSGDDTAIVIATPIGSAGAPYTTEFPCADGTGDTQPLPPGMYRVEVEIDDHAQPFATSLPEIATLVAGPADVEVDIYRDAGYFAARWELQTMTGQAMSCAVAGVDEVDIITNDGSGDQLFAFSCDMPPGITGPLRDGGDMVRLQAMSSAKLRGVSAIVNDGITGPNTVTDLGTVPIVLGP